MAHLAPGHHLWSRLRRRVVAALSTSALAVSIVACASGHRRGAPPGTGAAPLSDTAATVLFDPSDAYRGAGMLIARGTLPFVAGVRFLRGRTSDTTLVLVALSLANRSLTFSGQGQARAATYAVTLTLRRGVSAVALAENRETVRVGSFRETTRTDESIVYQRFLLASPGAYDLDIEVRDVGGRASSVATGPISVPALGAGTIGSPVVAYEASPRFDTDSLPGIIANPRATLTYGRDSASLIYVEAYDIAPERRVIVDVIDGEGVVRVRDTLAPPSSGSLLATAVRVSVPRLGVGRLRIVARVLGSRDSVVAPLFVGFGDSIGIATLDQMLGYLRYYASPDRLRALRDTNSERRARAWATFWSDAESRARPGEFQSLRSYFARIAEANRRFRDAGQPGWLSDRGRVFITMGDADQILERGDVSDVVRARAQLWVYASYRLQLVFVDEGGFGRWRLTPGSEADYDRVLARLQMR